MQQNKLYVVLGWRDDYIYMANEDEIETFIAGEWCELLLIIWGGGLSLV